MNADKPMSHEHLNHEHLSDNALIDAVYGLSGDAEREALVRTCALCAARWNDLEEKRAAIAMPMNVSPAALAEQRRNVYRRIEHPSPAERASRWAVPALAGVAACVLAIGLLLHGPGNPASSVLHTARPAAVPAAVGAAAGAGDTQLYTDIYTMEQSFEPSASASLGVLFAPEEAAVNPQCARPGTAMSMHSSRPY